MFGFPVPPSASLPSFEAGSYAIAQAVSEVLGHLSSFLALDSFLSCRTHGPPVSL